VHEARVKRGVEILVAAGACSAVVAVGRLAQSWRLPSYPSGSRGARRGQLRAAYLSLSPEQRLELHQIAADLRLVAELESCGVPHSEVSHLLSSVDPALSTSARAATVRRQLLLNEVIQAQAILAANEWRAKVENNGGVIEKDAPHRRQLFADGVGGGLAAGGGGIGRRGAESQYQGDVDDQH